MISKVFPKIHAEGYKFLVIFGIATLVLYFISSFLGIRKKEQLSDDLNNISFGKVIFLFISINVVFIGLVLIVTTLLI